MKRVDLSIADLAAVRASSGFLPRLYEIVKSEKPIEMVLTPDMPHLKIHYVWRKTTSLRIEPFIRLFQIQPEARQEGGFNGRSIDFLLAKEISIPVSIIEKFRILMTRYRLNATGAVVLGIICTDSAQFTISQQNQTLMICKKMRTGKTWSQLPESHLYGEPFVVLGPSLVLCFMVILDKMMASHKDEIAEASLPKPAARSSWESLRHSS